MDSGTIAHDFDFESADRIDILCDEFEVEHRAGRDPVIEDFVARSPEQDRSSLLVELVLLDVAYRERRGESPVLSDYAARFPEESESLRHCFRAELESADRSFDSTVTQAGVRTPAAEPLARLGRYELVDILGTGGFGEVWKARDPALDRWVAVKTLRSDKEFPPEVVENFLEEGRKLAQLEHPSIVPVYDVGYEQDRFYIVSKLIWGETLEDMVRRETRLSPVEAAEMVARIADALHTAHLRGLVHRDIKPSNILLDESGRPHLADFGLAISEEEQLDEGPSVVGTYAYMSPEQVRGSSHLVDARSDIYSLGAVLYRLVTGRPPFLGRNRSEWEQQIQSRPPRPPRTVKDDIPAGLEEVCLKCLSKDPEQRYTTAGDLARALDVVQHAKDLRPEVPQGGRRVVPVIASCFLIAAMAAALLTWWKQSGDEPQFSVPDDVVVPNELVWPIHDEVSDWFVTDDGRRLSLTCEQTGLIEIGELTPLDREITLDISQVNWSGDVGFFWGYRPAGDGRDRIQFESIVVDKQFNGKFVLNRSITSFDRPTTQNPHSDGVTADIENPGEGPHSLTVRFENARLVGVEWDGAEKPELLDTFAPWSSNQNCEGRIGCRVQGTTGVFSNIQRNGQRLHFSRPQNR